MPTIDGAPGGTLEGFGILAEELAKLPAWMLMKSAASIPSHCFVPAVSAVAIRNLDTDDDLYASIDDLPAGRKRTGRLLVRLSERSPHQGHRRTLHLDLRPPAVSQPDPPGGPLLGAARRYGLLVFRTADAGRDDSVPFSGGGVTPEAAPRVRKERGRAHEP